MSAIFSCHCRTYSGLYVCHFSCHCRHYAGPMLTVLVVTVGIRRGTISDISSCHCRHYAGSYV